jgi:hypothetical protein
MGVGTDYFRCLGTHLEHNLKGPDTKFIIWAKNEILIKTMKVILNQASMIESFVIIIKAIHINIVSINEMPNFNLFFDKFYR